MRAWLHKLWASLLESYWFVPTLMAAAAVGLAFLLIAIDAGITVDGATRLGWLLVSQPEGARALLSTVAGSMITVAGVSFSVTLVALATATSQYGPRLFSLFLRDRGVQVTLGVFSATFIYCLIVLRVIRSAPHESSVQSASAFVPHLAVLGALVFALAAVGVFIYFIHHIAQVMRVSSVISRAGRQILDGIDKLARTARAEDVTRLKDAAAAAPSSEPHCVRSDRFGYVQVIDVPGLRNLACEKNLVFSIETRRGEFLTEGRTLVRAWGEKLDDETAGAVRKLFAVGQRRTHEQDILFTVDQIVQIAARALSPGVNDPFTAMTCMDWLEEALHRFADVPASEAFGYTDGSRLRVIVPTVTFARLCEAAIGQITPYASADVNAALHQVRSMQHLAGHGTNAGQRQILMQTAARVLASAEQALAAEHDREQIRLAVDAVMREARRDAS